MQQTMTIFETADKHTKQTRPYQTSSVRQVMPPKTLKHSRATAFGYSLQGGAVGGGCSGLGQYYIVKQCITPYKSLYPVSTAPPFAECRALTGERPTLTTEMPRPPHPYHVNNTVYCPLDTVHWILSTGYLMQHTRTRTRDHASARTHTRTQTAAAACAGPTTSFSTTTTTRSLRTSGLRPGSLTRSDSIQGQTIFPHYQFQPCYQTGCNKGALNKMGHSNPFTNRNQRQSFVCGRTRMSSVPHPSFLSLRSLPGRLSACACSCHLDRFVQVQLARR